MKPPPQRAAVIANRVRLKRGLYPNAVFLLVEGDDDAKLYRRFVDERRCRVQSAYGRPNVEAALAILEADHSLTVLGIIDADFDVLEGRAADRANLLRTDTHDAETMMLASPALDHVLREHGSEDAIAALEKSSGQTVRDRLLDLARLLGALRWISARKNLRLRFEDFPFADIVDKKAWTVRDADVLSALQGHSQAGALDRAALSADVDTIFSSAPDLWQLCCGHDMVAILAIGLQRAIGEKKPAEVKPEVLEKDLRLAYEAAYFATTALFRAMRAWEERQRPVLIDPLRAAS